jgi:hypothetical protein
MAFPQDTYYDFNHGNRKQTPEESSEIQLGAAVFLLLEPSHVNMDIIICQAGKNNQEFTGGEHSNFEKQPHAHYQA